MIYLLWSKVRGSIVVVVMGVVWSSSSSFGSCVVVVVVVRRRMRWRRSGRERGEGGGARAGVGGAWVTAVSRPPPLSATVSATSDMAVSLITSGAKRLILPTKNKQFIISFRIKLITNISYLINIFTVYFNLVLYRLQHNKHENNFIKESEKKTCFC